MSMTRTLAPGLLTGLLLLTAQSAHAAPPPHRHGVAKLDITLDGGTLTLDLELPLDTAVGFEHSPRNDAERRAIAETAARLRNGMVLFKLAGAAQCSLAGADVKLPMHQAAEAHADFDAAYVFTCRAPAQLGALDQGLFDAFKRLEQVDVRFSGPQGQKKAELKRPVRQLSLNR